MEETAGEKRDPGRSWQDGFNCVTQALSLSLQTKLERASVITAASLSRCGKASYAYDLFPSPTLAKWIHCNNVISSILLGSEIPLLSLIWAVREQDL